MLEKDVGEPFIHRLRLIVLLEADFNMALRLIWMKRLFCNAEADGFVAEQWGNRKDKSAMDCLTMKLLTCESVRIMRHRAALMAMDAAACYDRIITYLSNISERRYGLPKNACKTKGSAIFEMKRHVRTAFGDSAHFYTSTDNDLMHGECQGKTSSPPSWTIFTITLLRALKHYNPGIQIESVDGSVTIQRVADMFVDDCDLWTSLPPDSSEEDLVKRFTIAAQSWERLLFATGGLLALHKCYWWFITWDWENEMPVPRQSKTDEFSVELSNGNDEVSVPITRLELHESNVGLGFRLSPNGSQQREFHHRLSLSDRIAEKVNASSLNSSDAWVFYNSIYVRVFFG